MKKNLSLVFALIFAIAFLLHKATPSYVGPQNLPTGDTIEYKASAYVIQPNDKLADLLVQMAEVHIDKDGTIYAQGDTVKKLLVDGDEFFADAPSVGIHALRADKVDKVQFYYRVSDQAIFTGVEDKVKIKTMNVKLKKEKGVK